MTTESSKSGAITLSCVNFSGFVGHVTIFSGILIITACCFVVGLGLGSGLGFKTRISFSVYMLVSGRIYTTFRCHCHPAVAVLRWSQERHPFSFVPGNVYVVA